MKTKIRKIVSFSLMILGFSCVGIAQQEAQFTQYMFNRLSFNPAYAGSSGSMCASIIYRNQWMGLQLDPPAPGYEAGSTPTDYLFTFDTPVKFLHGGIGFVVSQDNIGYHSAFSGHVDYAFRIYWGPGNLAAGFEGSFFSSTFNYTQLVGHSDFTGNYQDPVQSQGDPSIGSEKDASDFLVDLSAGLYYQVPGLYYFGISGKNLLATESDVLNWKNARVIYLTGGYEYALAINPSFKLKPSALIKTADFSIFQVDLSCLLEYQNAFWGGINYRLNDAVSVLAGVRWNKLSLGLSYDMTTSRLGYLQPRLSAGTLEAYLRYCFKIVVPPKPPMIYRNTRFLGY